MNVIGVDEVGRGCLAGPVVVCAYRPRSYIKTKLKDSKAYKASEREDLNFLLRESGDFIIKQECNLVIDKINILQACLKSMAEAIEELSLGHEEIIVDGNQLPPKKYFKLNKNFAMRAEIKGDSRFYEVAAASIIAKVYRDNLMMSLDKEFPGYGFASNKGYGSKSHLEYYKKNGPTSIHRLSFKPKSFQI